MLLHRVVRVSRLRGRDNRRGAIMASWLDGKLLFPRARDFTGGLYSLVKVGLSIIFCCTIYQI